MRVRLNVSEIRRAAHLVGMATVGPKIYEIYRLERDSYIVMHWHERFDIGDKSWPKIELITSAAELCESLPTRNYWSAELQAALP